MIWLIGTTRIVRVVNNTDREPTEIAKYLQLDSADHSYIYGEFEIFPTEPDEAGHMRSACVAGAEKLVVQDVGGLNPAFRIPSTWPPKNQSAPSR